jgi:hypothetical protein
MARLIDELRSAAGVKMPRFVVPEKQAAWANHARHLWKLIEDMGDELPVIVADNVAEYYFTGTGQEQWNIQNDFPNVAPPYPLYWLEHHLPKHIHSEQGDTDLGYLPLAGARVGWLLITVPVEDAVGTNIPANTKWICMADHFYQWGRAKDGMIEGPHGAMVFPIDERGQVIEPPMMHTYTRGTPEDRHLAVCMMGGLNPVLLTISFLHCKNVKTEDHVVPAKLAKRRAERHGGPRPMRYKTLVIEPLKQTLRRVGGSDKHGIAKAMHICRGQFWDYREGPGLFGKLNILCWHEAHVRGTKGKRPAPRELKVKL